MVATQCYYSLILVVYCKTEDVFEDFSKDNKMFDFSNYKFKSKYYDD